jgi:hypothetical protein
VKGEEGVQVLLVVEVQVGEQQVALATDVPEPGGFGNPACLGQPLGEDRWERTGE